MKLSFKNKIAYSSAAIGDAATYSIVGTFLMFFLTTVGHVSPAIAGTLIAAGSVWDVVGSLIIGYWSDHSSSRMGRRRPFLMTGATLLAISCSLLFYTVDAGPVFRVLYYGVMILIFWAGFSTFYVPFLALGAEFTDDYTERTHLRSFAYGFNMLGTLLGIVLPSIIVDLLISGGFSRESSWHITGTFVGIVSAATIYLTVLLSKDKDIPRQAGDAEKPKIEFRVLVGMAEGYLNVLKLRPLRILLLASVFYLVSNTIYGADRLYFYTYNLGLSAALVSGILLLASFNGLLFMPVILFLSRWLDKRSLLMIMMMISAVLVTAARFTGIATFTGMILFTFIYSIGSTAYWQLMPAILYDICEYDELETGNRRQGTIVSLQSVAEALSQAVAMQFLGIVLELAGFNGESPMQTPAALEWIGNSLTIIPAVFMILTVIMIYRYPITKKKFEEIQEELRNRR
jgi:GPH family glycoside/pentoside/hexuronide:cation symporter